MTMPILVSPYFLLSRSMRGAWCVLMVLPLAWMTLVTATNQVSSRASWEEGLLCSDCTLRSHLPCTIDEQCDQFQRPEGDRYTTPGTPMFVKAITYSKNYINENGESTTAHGINVTFSVPYNFLKLEGFVINFVQMSGPDRNQQDCIRMDLRNGRFNETDEEMEFYYDCYFRIKYNIRYNVSVTSLPYRPSKRNTAYDQDFIPVQRPDPGVDWKPSVQAEPVSGKCAVQANFTVKPDAFLNYNVVLYKSPNMYTGVRERLWTVLKSEKISMAPVVIFDDLLEKKYIVMVEASSNTSSRWSGESQEVDLTGCLTAITSTEVPPVEHGVSSPSPELSSLLLWAIVVTCLVSLFVPGTICAVVLRKRHRRPHVGDSRGPPEEPPTVCDLTYAPVPPDSPLGPPADDLTFQSKATPVWTLVVSCGPPQHAAVVRALATFMERNCKCQVRWPPLDIRHWLASDMNAASRVVIINSTGLYQKQSVSINGYCLAGGHAEEVVFAPSVEQVRQQYQGQLRQVLMVKLPYATQDALPIQLTNGQCFPLMDAVGDFVRAVRGFQPGCHNPEYATSPEGQRLTIAIQQAVITQRNDAPWGGQPYITEQALRDQPNKPHWGGQLSQNQHPDSGFDSGSSKSNVSWVSPDAVMGKGGDGDGVSLRSCSSTLSDTSAFSFEEIMRRETEGIDQHW